jgi:hypothetical protein
MPDNTRPPRNPHHDQGSNLGTRALMNAIGDLAKERGVAGARVAGEACCPALDAVARVTSKTMFGRATLTTGG